MTIQRLAMVRRYFAWQHGVNLLLTLLLLIGTSTAHAQTEGMLPASLSREARTAVQRIVDSARTAGLPTTQLIDKAAEGVLKGADERRIVSAVRTLARELGDARAVVGSNAGSALLAASASALHAGVSPGELRELLRPAGNARPDDASLATALVTLVDLVAKRIAPHDATSAVGELLQRQASDAQFSALRTEVERDVQGGMAPSAALKSRMRTHLQTLDGTGRGGTDSPLRRPTDGTAIPKNSDGQ